jgi:hypothetical protein
MSSMPDILREKSNRLFFLKAILLGIQYAESSQRSEKKKMIEQEILKLESSATSSAPLSTLTSSFSQSQSPSFSQSSSILQKTDSSIQRLEDILNELYQKRVAILSQIGNISSSTYSKTLSFQQNQLNIQKINQLRALYAITNKDIEKFTLHHKKMKELQENPQFTNPSQILKQNNKSTSNFQQQNIQSFISTPSHTQIPQQNNQDEMEDSNDDFMKELQKTFGSLSSLLKND